MTGAGPNDLVYGHLGEATYDTETQDWYFTRQPTQSRQLKPTGKATAAIRPSLIQSLHSLKQTAVGRTQNIKKLTQAYPELIPGAFLYPTLAQASELVTDITSSHDPTTSGLLGFGAAFSANKSTSKVKSVPIVAIAGGVAGEVVRLFRLGREQLGWQGNKSVKLSCLGVRNGEQGSWYGNGSPIQQLCFAESKCKSGTWLAVRYLGAITILQPKLLEDPNPTILPPSRKAQSRQYPPSSIVAYPIITLPIQSSGGVQHADVAFNPWCHQQLAIIDQQGHWSVWNIERQSKRRGTWSAKSGAKGTIHKCRGEDSDSVSSDLDGWGSILWVGDVNTLVAVNRKNLAVVNLESDPQRLIVQDLGLAKTRDWILDIKRSPSNSSHLFVVTSSRVLWLRVPRSETFQKSERQDVNATVLLSWRHFRDEDDISLGLSLLNDAESQPTSAGLYSTTEDAKKATIVLLYSRLTSLITVFNFRISPPPLSIPLSVSDPYSLPVEELKDKSRHPTISMPNSSSKHPHILSLTLKPMAFDVRQRSFPSGLGYEYMNEDVKFYQLNILYNDRSLSQNIYAAVAADHTLPISPPDNKRQLGPKTTTKVAADSFVVPNGVIDEDLEEHVDSFDSLRTQEPNSKQEETAVEEDQWTLNYEWLAKQTQGISFTSSARDHSEHRTTRSFGNNLDMIRSTIIEKPLSVITGVTTLLEYSSMEISLEDIDTASTDLHDLITSAPCTPKDDGSQEEAYRFKISPLTSSATPSTLSLDLGFEVAPVLSQIYDSLVQSWIASFSSSVPGRVRLTKEKSIREIAAQICLASYGLQLNVVPNTEEETVGDEATLLEEQLVLPVRRKISLTNMTQKGKEKARTRSSSPIVTSSQLSQDAGFTQPRLPLGALPTPEPTPSLHSRSSRSSFLDSEDPSSLRLRALATLTPQPSLPPSLSNILTHWTQYTSPETYDWETDQAALVTTSDGEKEGTRNDSQAKKRRRLEKRKRQREMTIGSSSQPASTRPWGSQAEAGSVTATHQGGSTQATEDSVVPVMTQEERAVFGARKGKKGAKKGKRPGFR